MSCKTNFYNNEIRAARRQDLHQRIIDIQVKLDASKQGRLDAISSLNKIKNNMKNLLQKLPKESLASTQTNDDIPAEEFIIEMKNSRMTQKQDMISAVPFRRLAIKMGRSISIRGTVQVVDSLFVQDPRESRIVSWAIQSYMDAYVVHSLEDAVNLLDGGKIKKVLLADPT